MTIPTIAPIGNTEPLESGAGVGVGSSHVYDVAENTMFVVAYCIRVEVGSHGVHP